MVNNKPVAEILDGITPFAGFQDAAPAEAMVANGHAMQRTQTEYTTAVAVQRPRSLTRVAHNVIEEAQLAGASFYYSWSVKNKDGSKSKIEGGSIDLMTCIARHYGNCSLNVELIQETGTHYILKGYFIDLESGFTSPRLYRQRKSQNLGGRMDRDRAEDIAFQIGQSKAIRNAISQAMPAWMISKAIEVAKDAVFKQMKNANPIEARAKVLSFFAPYGVTQERIEAALGRPADEWTPDDLVELRGRATALKEKRAGVDELFPTPETQAEPEKGPSKEEMAAKQKAEEEAKEAARQKAILASQAKQAELEAKSRAEVKAKQAQEAAQESPGKAAAEMLAEDRDPYAEPPTADEITKCDARVQKGITEACEVLGLKWQDQIKPLTVSGKAYWKDLPQEEAETLLGILRDKIGEKQGEQSGGEDKQAPANREQLVTITRKCSGLGLSVDDESLNRFGQTLINLTSEQADAWIQELEKFYTDMAAARRALNDRLRERGVDPVAAATNRFGMQFHELTREQVDKWNAALDQADKDFPPSQEEPPQEQDDAGLRLPGDFVEWLQSEGETSDRFYRFLDALGVKKQVNLDKLIENIEKDRHTWMKDYKDLNV